VQALSSTAQAAGQAYAARQMTLVSVVDLQTALLAKRMDALALERTLFEKRIALQALLGGELPQVLPEAHAPRTASETIQPQEKK